MVETLKSHITQIHKFISGKLQSPQRIKKYFFTSQKITINKVVLCISKKLQSAKPFFTSANTQSRKKPQERERREERERRGERKGEREKEKEKGKEKEKRNEKEKEKEKRGDREKRREDRNNGESGT